MNRPASPFTGTIRFGVPLPIVIPLGALLFIAIVTIGMSRILLSVPKEVAVVIALAIAANILIACSVLALRPSEARVSWAEFLVAATFPLVIAIALALTMGTDTSAGEATEHSGGAGATGGELEIAAENVAFNTDEIQLPADEEASLHLTNSDSSSVQHNISIYEDDSASKELFKGQTIPGGQDVTYEIPGLPKGEYYFQCDVHPGMNGTVTVQ
jgi:plastocyanin